ncbi:hypothetical protein [Streptomyces sp. MUM 16J]|uniref:hypothetical protein n=1 Tax=Streptomyces sp. MUM 16J TaxID=2791988 RepID=UPI001F03A7E4|nr:hypothetical protein [Streptomyces sp. MUM 16J]MCH0555812.1 hypothetical protein [Streptomyces sp. MUM 16J]
MPLTNAHYPNKNPEWLLSGRPTGLYRSNMPRIGVVSDFASLTTQVMQSAALYLQGGDLVTNLTFKSGSTAAVSPAHWWFALYDDAASPALLAQSADQGAAAWAASTAMTLALASTVTIPHTGIYHAAVMVAATTPPSLLGAGTVDGAVGGFLADDVVLAQNSGGSLTDTAPATISGGSAIGFVPRVVAT